MVDFLYVSKRVNKNGIDIVPVFRLYPKSQDLMIRGGDFYAIWNDEIGLWSTNEDDALAMIDAEINKVVQECMNDPANSGKNINAKYTWDSTSGAIDSWHKYCQKQKRDSYVMLDETLVFSNSPTNKKDYASKRLPYPLEKGSTAAYDKIMSTLYSDEEREKIEWAIGAIVSGDSKKIQKFMVGIAAYSK